jgi:hypothetical protein
MNKQQLVQKKENLLNNYKQIEARYNELSSELENTKQQLFKFAGAIELIVSMEQELDGEVTDGSLGEGEGTPDFKLLELVKEAKSEDL